MFEEAPTVESANLFQALSLASILEFFAETQFLVLLLFAVVSHHVAAAYVAHSPWRPAAKYMVAPFALLFGWRLLSESPFRSDLGVAIAIMARWLVACWIVQNCAAMPGAFVLHLLVRYAQREWEELDKYTRELHDWYLSQRIKPKPAPVIPVTAPPSRESLLASNSEQAKLDFEFECRIIKRADLDELEREAALEQAKQKYLEKLCQVLQ